MATMESDTRNDMNVASLVEFLRGLADGIEAESIKDLMGNIGQSSAGAPPDSDLTELKPRHHWLEERGIDLAEAIVEAAKRGEWDEVAEVVTELDYLLDDLTGEDDGESWLD